MALIVFGWSAAIVAVITLTLWTMGLIVSDRWGWSQWLEWIPSIAALLAAVLGWIAAWRPSSGRSRLRRVLFWTATFILVAGYVAFVDHRLFRGHPSLPADALSIVHWNASPGASGDRRRAIDLALDLDADITFITDAHLIPWQGRVQSRLGEHGYSAGSMPFAFISRMPILDVRLVVAVDRIYAVWVRIDATESAIGRQLTLLAIDMPSDLSQSRMEIAMRLHRLLHEAGTPPDDADIVLGDFNITRGSQSLKALLPGARHAWTEAGRGWSGTYPRHRPLLHIDHIFTQATSLEVLDYEIIDLGVGRHRAQRAVIRSR